MTDSLNPAGQPLKSKVVVTGNSLKGSPYSQIPQSEPDIQSDRRSNIGYYLIWFWVSLLIVAGFAGLIYFSFFFKKLEAGPGRSVVEAPSMSVPVAQQAQSTQQPPPAVQKTPTVSDMLNLAGGVFKMGSGDDLSELPVHAVTVQKFLLATHATTLREWQECVAAGACPAVVDGLPDEPVRNVSWDDTQRYIAWLSHETGYSYRLPTEAEWEFAARIGSGLLNVALPGAVSCTECGKGSKVRAPPAVNAHSPDRLGLYAIGGGVTEWVADCWHSNYKGAPQNGSIPWQTQGCPERVLRGASWLDNKSEFRPSTRQSYDASVRYPTHGFRLAHPDYR